MDADSFSLCLNEARRVRTMSGGIEIELIGGNKVKRIGCMQ